MSQNPVSRRDFVLALGATSLALPAATAAAGQEAGAPQTAQTQPESRELIASRARRLAWWREAKFGMFVHWGLYSVIGHQEWVMESEGIPIPQYEILAQHFTPKPNAAREWARLAKRAGQKYMVMTAKHHEGFCMWDTRLTDLYCAARDIILGVPGVAGILQTSIGNEPARRLDRYSRSLLVEAGLAKGAAAAAHTVLYTYLLGSIALEETRSAAVTPRARRLTATHFRAGLDVVVAGIKSSSREDE